VTARKMVTILMVKNACAKLIGECATCLSIIERVPKDDSKIFFGAWVTLADEEGEERQYRIVGPDEFNVKENKISLDSPLARALVGKRLDEEIHFESPEGDKYYHILGIHYSPP